MTIHQPHPKLTEARAILHSIRANLCPHGVKWRDCHDHPDHPDQSTSRQEDHR